MDVLSEASLAELIGPDADPSTVDTVKSSMEPIVVQYETAANIQELLAMMGEAPQEMKEIITDIYSRTHGHVDVKLAAARKELVTTLVKGLLSMAREKMQRDIDTQTCSLHPNCAAYRHPRINNFLLESGVSHDNPVSQVVLERLAPVDTAIQGARTLNQMLRIVRRMCSGGTADMATNLATEEWTRQSGTPDERIAKCRSVIIQRLVKDAVIETQITNWRSRPDYGSIMGANGVTVRPSDDDEINMVELMRAESGRTTVLDDIPDADLLLFFGQVRDKAWMLSRIRTQLKPLAIALDVANTFDTIKSVIDRINGYDGVLDFIRTMSHQYYRAHATNFHVLNDVRRGIIMALLELEATATWMART